MPEPAEIALDLSTLTAHELRLAAIVGEGATNKAAARALTISIKTVEFHLGNVYRKLGISSRTELANLVGRHPTMFGRLRYEIVGNLPHDRAALVGRSHELDRLADLVAPGALVTVTGAGGVGKTRLAVAVADSAKDRFDDGAWMVELGSLASGRDVPTACLIALGLRQRAGLATVEELVGALGAQRRLIVLDNCEHVVDVAALVAASIVRRCPHVGVIATSRERLDVAEESIFALEPLLLEGEARPAAVRLFLERARSVLTDFEPTDEEIARVGDICRRLDGLPLAIELAAARLVGLSIAEVDAQLDEGLQLLARRRTMLGRHQSLSAAIQWSYELLSPDERDVFEAISCFVGDFDLVSAIAVTDPSSPDRVAACVASLIEKSMLTSRAHPAGRRFRLLETIREFALGRLRDRGDEGVVRRRLLDRFVSVINDAKLGLRGSDEPYWHDVFRLEWHNVRAALDIACSLDAGPDVCVLVDGTFWWGLTRSQAEVGEWAERVLLLPSVGSLPSRIVPLAAAAYFAAMRGDLSRGAEAYETAREQERRLGPWSEPWVSVVAPFVGDPNEILAANEETQQRARGAGDLFWEVVGILQEGALRGFLMTVTDVDADGVHLQRIRLGSELAAQLDNPNGIAYASKNLGAALVMREPDLAEHLLQQSLAIAGPLGLELLAGQAQNRACAAVLRTRPPSRRPRCAGSRAASTPPSGRPLGSGVRARVDAARCGATRPTGTGGIADRVAARPRALRTDRTRRARGATPGRTDRHHLRGDGGSWTATRVDGVSTRAGPSRRVDARGVNGTSTAARRWGDFRPYCGSGPRLTSGVGPTSSRRKGEFTGPWCARRVSPGPPG